MVRLMDIFFANFRWYRRWRGGIWTHEFADIMCGYTYWTRINWAQPTPHFVYVLQIEDYSQLKPKTLLI